MWLKRSISTLAFALLCVSSLTALAEQDVRGSGDDGLLERYRGSVIVNYQRSYIDNYPFVLGSIEKVNGQERAEKEQHLSGTLTRISYMLPENVSTKDALEFFQAQLTEREAKPLFNCQSRDCGSSNVWANSVFGYSKLYGLERSQYYNAYELPGQSVALYVIERGNRRVYAHVDIMETDPTARVKSMLKDEGYALLSINKLPEINLLESLSKAGSFGNAAIVIHHKGASIAQAVAQGEAQATELRSLLAQNQIAADIYSIGALSPSVLGQHQMVVVLVAGG